MPGLILENGPTFTLADLGHDMSAVRERITKEIATAVDNKYAAWYNALGDNPAIAWNAARAKSKEGAKWMENLGMPPEDLVKNSFYRKLANYGGTAEGSVWRSGAPMTAEQWNSYLLDFCLHISQSKKRVSSDGLRTHTRWILTKKSHKGTRESPKG